jgi:thiamine biosynthesis protein ThiI
MDKLDIIETSKKIDTYEISIRPYEDCCTIFTPKNPKTAPNLHEVEAIEASYDWEPLIEEALQNIEVKFISEEEKTEELF